MVLLYLTLYYFTRPEIDFNEDCISVYVLCTVFLIGRIIFLLDLSDYSLLAYFAAVAALNVLLLKIFSQPRATITLRTMP